MKKWKLLPILIFLILINTGIACKERYNLNENVIIIDTIVSWGEGAQCNITTYNKTLGLINSSWMDRIELSYQKNLSNLPKGIYTSSIECNYSNNVYLGECKFNVGINEKQMIAIMIGLGLCLVFFIYLVYVFKREFDGLHKEWLAPVKFIFISLAYFMMMGILRVGIVLLKDNGKTNLASVFNSLWVTLMIIFGFIFFIVMFLYGIRFVWAIVERRKWGE